MIILVLGNRHLGHLTGSYSFLSVCGALSWSERTMEAALEGPNTILGAALTWYTCTICRKSKLKAIQRAKTQQDEVEMYGTAVCLFISF